MSKIRGQGPSGLTTEQVDDVLDSDAYGALSAELRRAEANHHDLDTLLPRLIQARALGDADDIASVIHHRLERATTRPAGSGRTRKPPRLIAGLIPEASGLMVADMRQALDERRDLIKARSQATLDLALEDGERWVRHLGSIPEEPRGRQQWRRNALVIATYRDLYGVTTSDPLGPTPRGAAHRLNMARAQAALDGQRGIWTRGPSSREPSTGTQPRHQEASPSTGPPSL